MRQLKRLALVAIMCIPFLGAGGAMAQASADYGIGPGWGAVDSIDIRKTLSEMAEQYEDSDLVLRYGSPDSIIQSAKYCCHSDGTDCRRYFLYCSRMYSYDCGNRGVSCVGTYRFEDLPM